MPNSSRTKRALLDAGRKEFARYGLAGGRTDRIAAVSRVNKQRIYAYFGSKEGLFEAVVDDALEDLLDVVPLPSDAPDAAATVRDYLGNLVAYHRKHPELMRLMQWESLERTSAIDLRSPRALKCQAKVQTLATWLGLTPEQTAPLLVQIILLATGPQAVLNLTAMVLATGPQAALTKTGEAGVTAAMTLIAAAARQADQARDTAS
ncbi:MAG: TetR/AcrR family transcriptional regulator [Micrococcales bacterium]|nr:TetR/AcrR family transcriptional regulator [Micrococcales bacterium]